VPLRTLDLVTPIRDNRIPAWLEALLVPYGGDDPWDALLVLGGCHSEWGGSVGVGDGPPPLAVFLSRPRLFQKAWTVVPVAKKLGVECA
jgi:hypothetical protein